MEYETARGQLMTSFREDGDYDWSYLEVTLNLNPFIRWVILDGWLSINRPDGSYATKDLLQRHESKKIDGSTLATLVLLNREKVNPVLT